MQDVTDQLLGNLTTHILINLDCLASMLNACYTYKIEPIKLP